MLTELIKNYDDKQTKLELIEKCLINVVDNVNTSTSLKLITIILMSFPVKTFYSDSVSLESAVQTVVRKGMINDIVISIQSFKEKI